ncbi:hypothetical protein [Leptospira stimsonii]|uniref:hypothetical protein n=1 Tax=Leptospira stimsonii TaxID=2202203 RepID=UPI0019D52078|nr:hypothetical protein [Leptospira stimsonii]
MFLTTTLHWWKNGLRKHPKAWAKNKNHIFSAIRIELRIQVRRKRATLPSEYNYFIIL